MSTQKYTPILVSKEGELVALSNLIHDHKIQIIPLIQLIPDPKEDRIKDYVQTRIKPLVDSWRFPNNRIYLDSGYLQQYDLDVTKNFFYSLREKGVYIIPVVYPDSPEWILDFYKDFINNGICLRIKSQNIDAQTITDAINKFKNFYLLKSEDVDLLIDFGYISASHEISYANSLELISLRVANIEHIRKCIISAGSFPPDLTNFPTDSQTPIVRAEWSLWNKIKNLKIGGQSLTYSDYGNAHPAYNLESANHRGTCSIKYTTDNDFYIFKGQRAQDHPLSTGQYKIKAQKLIEQSFYSGQSFSWGDQFIAHCAEGREKPGIPGTWVKITQNHHFVKTLELLK